MPPFGGQRGHPGTGAVALQPQSAFRHGGGGGGPLPCGGGAGADRRGEAGGGAAEFVHGRGHGVLLARDLHKGAAAHLVLGLVGDPQQGGVHGNAPLVVGEGSGNEPADVPGPLVQGGHQVLVGPGLGVDGILDLHLDIIGAEGLDDLQAVPGLQGGLLGGTHLFGHVVVDGHHEFVPAQTLVVEQAVVELLPGDAVDVLAAGHKDRRHGVGVFVDDGGQDVRQVDHAEGAVQPAHGAVQQADLPVGAGFLPDVEQIPGCQPPQHGGGIGRLLVEREYGRAHQTGGAFQRKLEGVRHPDALPQDGAVIQKPLLHRGGLGAGAVAGLRRLPADSMLLGGGLAAR